MPSTYTNLKYHVIFATKNRKPVLTTRIRERLFSYIQGIAKNNDFKIMALNGMEDHVHILVSLKTTVTLSKVMQLIKGNSSKWIHETFLELSHFGWQKGYGAFTVSYSMCDNVVNYIMHQEKHHKKMNFETEYREFLRKHDIDFDERYIF